MIRRSVASFQAEDVGDDVFCIVALDHKVWHGAMRGLERNSQRRARQARRFGNRLEGRGIGIGRAARHFIHEVALGACLMSKPEALLSTADLLRLRATRRGQYYRRDGDANRRCHTDQFDYWSPLDR